MGRRKQITAMILAAVFLISGCGGTKQTVRTSEKTEKDGIRSNGFSCVTDYGVLFCGNTDMLYLYDYGAKEAVPFCAVPIAVMIHGTVRQNCLKTGQSFRFFTKTGCTI